MRSLNCISLYNVNSRPRQENVSAYHTENICCFNPVIPGIARLCFSEVLSNICNVNSGSNNSQLFKFSLFKTDGSSNFILGTLFSLNATEATYQ